MKTIFFMTAAMAAACITTSASAADVQWADGTVRQEVAQNITKPPEQQQTPGTKTDNDDAGPQAWPHHQLNSHWYRHHKNTTNKGAAAPTNPDAVPKRKFFYHQVTTRWSRHYKNSTSPAP